MGRGSLLAQRIWQSCVYPKRQKMIDEAKIWIEATLKSQRPDGSFGPINMRGDKPELWARDDYGSGACSHITNIPMIPGYLT